MKTQTVTIPKKEYQRLKQLEKIDFELVQKFKNSLSDLKQGKFKFLA